MVIELLPCVALRVPDIGYMCVMVACAAGSAFVDQDRLSACSSSFLKRKCLIHRYVR